MAEIIWHNEKRAIRELIPYEANPRQITDKQAKDLKASLAKFGIADPIIINTDNMIIGGHQRKKILETLLGYDPDFQIDVRVPDRELSIDEARELNIRLNKNTGAWDFDVLANEFELPDLVEWGFEPFELGINNEPAPDNAEHQTLADKFIVPPFSVLDARQGYWQERKRTWLALGIRGELGRGEDMLALQGAPERQANYKSGKGLARCYGQDLMKGENTNFIGADRRSADKRSNITGAPKMPAYADIGMEYIAPGTSIFDPVLCELVYRWFMPAQGSVLDPFAGGSVRGIVAAKLGHKYTGIDLSARQIEANRVQADELLTDNKPDWIVGDSKRVNELAPGEYDLIFSCPPYADLEVYSDDPSDLSNMDYPDFKSAYHEIVYGAVAMLKQDRFACFVVGDVRDKKGFYRNFVSDTIEAFQDAGATLYNEAILVTAVGSLPIRVSRAFQAGRKLGKTHQNVLVFYKGDPKAIKTWGDVECGDIEPVLLGS